MSEINLLNMIESRILDILQMEQEAKRKRPKLFSQRLPRFMRRRAACHNIKRLPRKLQSRSTSGKSRKSLMKFRRRDQFRRHKRILRKHSKHDFQDPTKCLIHKWFAKRFKLAKDEPWKNVPLYNNTKNRRNLYRQSVYGCAYFSMGHLIPISLTLCIPDKKSKFMMLDQLEKLNKLTNESSGFTFCAISLEKCRYELTIKLFDVRQEYICDALVYLDNYDDPKSSTKITLWVPRDKHQNICDKLRTISADCKHPFEISTIMPRELIRIRLVGPDARERALSICEDREKHEMAISETDIKCRRVFGCLMGRFEKGIVTDVIYFNTEPNIVDIVFKGPKGRMLWYKLIKNNSHLVGGQRDFEILGSSACSRH